MIKLKSFIGTEVDNTTRLIERGLLKNLQRALCWDNHHHPHPHHEQCLETLPAFMLGHMINIHKIYKNLGLNINQVLLSRESIICPRPIHRGESLHIKTFLRDAYEQQASSNPIGFVILESVGNVESESAFYCERVLAVRGGFSRGRSI
jgi:hypothetical protein